MATKNKQLNVRMDEETEARLERLVKTGSAVVGLALSQSDVIRLALQALEEKYTAAEAKKAAKK
jgi:Arc/MetJ-type ribon-helix-helix transcriptional regulator